MPCGGIYPMGADPEAECWHCHKGGADHMLIEWDSYLHGACIEAFLKTDEGQCVLGHKHVVIRELNGVRDILAVEGQDTVTDFDRADYYDCSEDNESLSHESPEEAIEYHIDDLYEKGVPVAKTIEDACPLTVYGFKRTVVPPSWVNMMAERLTERFGEEWVEEYGNPNESLGGIETANLESGFIDTIKKFLNETQVWACEKTAEKTYNFDEVVKMMKEENPEWFEEKEVPVATEAAQPPKTS